MGRVLISFLVFCIFGEYAVGRHVHDGGGGGESNVISRRGVAPPKSNGRNFFGFFRRLRERREARFAAAIPIPAAAPEAMALPPPQPNSPCGGRGGGNGSGWERVSYDGGPEAFCTDNLGLLPILPESPGAFVGSPDPGSTIVVRQSDGSGYKVFRHTAGAWTEIGSIQPGSNRVNFIPGREVALN